jgi:predicted permease
MEQIELLVEVNVAYWDALAYCWAVPSPVFIIVLLGFILKERRSINDAFVASASALVFKVCLPTLIFLSILQNQVNLQEQLPLVIYCVGAAIVSFLLFWWLARYRIPLVDRGVVVQGAFRSNLGIIGFALCAKEFGQEGLAVGAVILAVVTPVYNILSVYALNTSLKSQHAVPMGKILADIAKNPLIIAIALGFVAIQLDFKLPKVLYDTGTYLANMTLPLALIAIGGSLSLKDLKDSSRVASVTVFAKLVIAPLIAVIPAWFMGFRGAELGCILFMFASPTAAASFVMVHSLGGNHILASNIIVLSTLFSALSISTLLYVAKLLAWV